MAIDKKISELQSSGALQATDKFPIARVGTDVTLAGTVQFILDFVSTNLSVGSTVTFGTGTPQNNVGANGDVYWKTNDGKVYQKISGTWTVKFTVPTSGGADGTVLYGNGAPGNAVVSIDGDTYVDVLAGVFYKKEAGQWNQKFSMLSGPAGPKGDQGDTGATGAKGDQGDPGDNGWSPVLAIVNDGQRRVFQVADWVGGEGAKPPVGYYVADAGLTNDISLAVDVRGPAGISGVIYQGTWNAATNTPTLASGVGTQGHYYVVSVDGNTNLNGITDWKVGDWVIFNGTAWEKVDNTDQVTSVNGKQGAVTLTTADIADSTNKRYVTDANLVVINNTSGINTGDETQASIISKLGFTPADDANVVHKTGGEFVGGIKVFTNSLYANENFYISDAFVDTPNTGFTGIFGNATGLIFKRDTFKVSINYADSANKVYTLPASNGTLALLSDIPSLAGYVPTSRKLTINGTQFDLSADRTWTISTATTLAALTDVALASLADGQLLKYNASTSKWVNFTPNYLTGNQTITLTGDVTGSGTTNITTAIASSVVTAKLLTGYAIGTNTALAATDSILTAFGKVQAQLDAKGTGTIGGSGSANTVAKFTAANTIGNSNILDSGTLITLNSNSYVNGNFGIGLSSPAFRLDLVGSAVRLRNTITDNGVRLESGAGVVYIGSWGNDAMGILSNGISRIYVNTSGFVAIGNTSPVAPFNLSLAVSAAGGIARGAYLNQTITAAANNDVLAGLDIDTTYSIGAFTGVSRFPLRVSSGGITRTTVDYGGVQKWFLMNTTNSTEIGSIQFSTPGGFPGMSIYTGATYDQNRYDMVNYAGTFSFGFNNGSHIRTINIFNTNRVGIATTVDSGYTFDVNGTARIQGQFFATGNSGIGTLSPYTRLDVFDYTSFLTITSNINAEATSDGQQIGGINFRKHYGMAIGAAIRQLQSGGTSNYTQAHLSFYTNDGSIAWDSPVERIRITSIGAVRVYDGNLSGGGNFEFTSESGFGARFQALAYKFMNNTNATEYARLTSTGFQLATTRSLVFDGTGNTFSIKATATGGLMQFFAGGSADTNIAIQVASDKTVAIYNVYNRQSASYTLVLGDAGRVVETNVAAANNVTVPTNASVAFPIGTEIQVMQYGAGQTTIVAAAGVTLRSKSGQLKIGNQYTGVTLLKVGTNEWYVIGNVSA